MIRIEWTHRINKLWWESPNQTVDEWAEQFGATFAETHDGMGLDYLVFESDEDALVFKLKLGL